MGLKSVKEVREKYCKQNEQFDSCSVCPQWNIKDHCTLLKQDAWFCSLNGIMVNDSMCRDACFDEEIAKCKDRPQNKQLANMKKSIEYSNKSWNPYSGCNHIEKGICSVGTRCWAYRMANRLKGRYGYNKYHPFRPTLHYDKLKQPLKWKKPRMIASCFMGDIACCPDFYLYEIMKVVRHCPQHIFYFLTKDPLEVGRKEVHFPDNAYIGVTVNRQNDVHRIVEMNKIDAKVKYVSFEPVYEHITFNPNSLDWIIIGSQTNPTLHPDHDDVQHILNLADECNVPVFMKPNLEWNGERRMELPKVGDIDE